MAEPKITPTVDEHSCCSSKCCGNTCCSKNNLRASIGRIAVGIILLGSMFIFGMKAGMIGNRGGREGNGGCSTGWRGGCGKNNVGGCPMSNNYFKNNQGNTENLPAPQANVVPAEEILAPEAVPTPEDTAPIQ